MAAEQDRIDQLAPEVQAKIRSSVQISSLLDVILGLAENSLDAGAGHIEIHLDFLKGYCSVLDDGHGILKDEFLQGRIGKLYFTSKYTGSQTYGRYGRFLASLSGVSLLSITSLHTLEHSTTSVVFKDGKLVAVTTDLSDEELDRTEHGTRVVVHNLFGQMPVRVKRRHMLLESQRELDKAFAALKRSLVDLILAASQPCYFNVRDAHHRYIHKPQAWLCPNHSTFSNTEPIASTLFQAGFLESADTSMWRQASVRVSHVTLSATISLQPAPSKQVQFISLNQHPLPLGLSVLFDEINALFDSSTFATSFNRTQAENVTTTKVRTGQERHIGRREVDRWPMFYIRINIDSGASSVFEWTELESNRLFSSIRSALHILITEFLQSHDFRSRRPEIVTKVKRHSQPFDPDSIHSISHFGNSSRIRSGTGVPTDLLSGLPFFPSEQFDSRKIQFSASARDTSTANETEESTIEWFNPQTGSTLHIDTRTGMAVPINRPGQPYHHPVSQRNCQSRTIDDVTNTLKGHFPFAVEEALKSVATDYESHEHSHKFDDNQHVCISNSGSPLHISGPTKVEPVELNIKKDDLKTANVIGQVDKKFILVSLVSEDHTKLVLIDQHAADERVKVEELYRALCNDIVVSLTTPIIFEVNQQEVQRFKHSQSYLATCGIHYSVTNHVQVSALPKLIAEKCRLEPKLLVDLLRAEIWKEVPPFKSRNKSDDWLMQIGAFPQGVLDLLASRACRSAIMFNDGLAVKECQDLVQRLCECSFPFQCAHARPSMTIIARIRNVNREKRDSSFEQRWKAWT